MLRYVLVPIIVPPLKVGQYHHAVAGGLCWQKHTERTSEAAGRQSNSLTTEPTRYRLVVLTSFQHRC